TRPASATTSAAIPSPRPALARDRALASLVDAAGWSLAGWSVVALSAAAFASFTVGAGCSGSLPSEAGSSIQRTPSPSEYVCNTLNTILSTSGNGPTDTSNSWNWPTWIAVSGLFAVHTIFVTASVTSPSSLLIGLSSFDLVATAVQPGVGLTATEAIGV